MLLIVGDLHISGIVISCPNNPGKRLRERGFVHGTFDDVYLDRGVLGALIHVRCGVDGRANSL